MKTKNIFIIDDSSFMQSQISSLLSDNGYEIVDRASDGFEALKKFDLIKEEIDIVTLDITMPMINGVDLLQRILKLKPDQKVIMVSGMSKINTIRKCIELGAKEFINKPFDENDFLSIINHVSML